MVRFWLLPRPSLWTKAEMIGQVCQIWGKHMSAWQCDQHLLLRRYLLNDNTYGCLECPMPKQRHSILYRCLPLFQILDFASYKLTRNLTLEDNPYDFSHSELREIDTLLRCPITKELFDLPKRLPCGHVVDDRSLHLFKHCPRCSQAITEQFVVADTLVEQLANEWCEKRRQYLQLDATLMNVPLIMIPKPLKVHVSRCEAFEDLEHRTAKFSLLSKSTKEAELNVLLKSYGLAHSNANREEKLKLINRFYRLFNYNLIRHRKVPLSDLFRDMLYTGMDTSFSNDIQRKRLEMQAQVHSIKRDMLHNKGVEM